MHKIVALKSLNTYIKSDEKSFKALAFYKDIFRFKSYGNNFIDNRN